ncbi:LMAN2L isoform 5 [Pan troglodytes]|uniref:Lectin, mannose binding 2 like n=2 Tax=Homininae TaxID=207598 RepID=F2Z2L5_HUMAN|nr:lectin, mannose binding 2 like [Homo sapiens]PNI88843.1 LMAN2L isoform 2 [Pan troglodytes]KAI2524360.1 lectin, mannose binding 2 like [Homo sapiens]KAI4035512.1 lectin, mannose binding 2 like [Homo sapiens]KAI4035514.1 lectin, mannose binding 2 like [Homo sapiens]
MAATLGPLGSWQQWRRCLSARDGSRMLLLLLLLGSGQGPQQVGAGQTFEYLKREHSLSKPYQAMFPERLGVAGALQNPWTRKEESAWGWLGNLVHKGSDAARACVWKHGQICGAGSICRHLPQ